MSTIEQKEKNLNQLISKLNSLTLTYSQPTYEVEKIKTEKNEILRQKIEIEKKNQELLREHKYLKEKIKNLQLEVKKKVEFEENFNQEIDLSLESLEDEFFKGIECLKSFNLIESENYLNQSKTIQY